MNTDNAINNSKTKIIVLELFVPHFNPLIPKQAIISEQFLSRTPTELQYVKKSFYMEEVNTQILWTFEIRTQEVLNIPIWKPLGVFPEKGKTTFTKF